MLNWPQSYDILTNGFIMEVIFALFLTSMSFSQLALNFGRIQTMGTTVVLLIRHFQAPASEG
jgi:hypothetical protein